MKFFHLVRSFPLVLAASRYLVSLNTNQLTFEDNTLGDSGFSSINAESIEILRNMNVERDIRIGKKFHVQVASLDNHSIEILKQSNLVKDVFPDLEVRLSLPQVIKEKGTNRKGSKEKPLQQDEPDVQYDDPDHLVRLSSVNPLNAFTNISDFNYYYGNTGLGTFAYVLDTGVAVDHPQFGGRVVESVNFASDDTTEDLHGHGTHVAGIIGSDTYGVAKGVAIVNVRVLNAQGSGTLVGIIEGISFAAAQREELNIRGVANLSLGSAYSRVLNGAVDAASDTGLVVVVAAGNEGLPAKNFSPASASNVITVGAIDDLTDQVTTFSNFGQAVDIFAPGFGVESLDVRNYSGSIRYSGTSMASPVVAGYVSTLLEYNYTTDYIRTFIKENAKLNSKAIFPYGIIGKLLYKTTTRDIVYNGFSSVINEPSEEEFENKQTVDPSISENSDITSWDLELIQWSAAKNGVEL